MFMKNRSCFGPTRRNVSSFFPWRRDHFRSVHIEYWQKHYEANREDEMYRDGDVVTPHRMPVGKWRLIKGSLATSKCNVILVVTIAGWDFCPTPYVFFFWISDWYDKYTKESLHFRIPMNDDFFRPLFLNKNHLHNPMSHRGIGWQFVASWLSYFG